MPDRQTVLEDVQALRIDRQPQGLARLEAALRRHHHGDGLLAHQQAHHPDMAEQLDLVGWEGEPTRPAFRKLIGGSPTKAATNSLAGR